MVEYKEQLKFDCKSKKCSDSRLTLRIFVRDYFKVMNLMSLKFKRIRANIFVG